MKKFNVAGASFRTEKIDFVLEKYYKDKSKQNSDSYFVDNQPERWSKGTRDWSLPEYVSLNPIKENELKEIINK